MTTSANAISKPTATGYNFGGYYTGTSCSGTMMINGSGNITENFTTKVFNEATTLYACWNRTFTCTNGAEPYYAGVKWRVIGNDTTNSICTMVLLGRTTNSGTYDARSTNVKTALTGGSVTGVTGTFNKTTITNEANVGLITSFDVGTGGTNPSGSYWVGSQTVYNSNTILSYSCTKTYLAHGYNYYNATSSNGSAMSYVQYGCRSVSSTTAHTGGKTHSATNSTSSKTWSNATAKSESISGYYSQYMVRFRDMTGYESSSINTNGIPLRKDTFSITSGSGSSVNSTTVRGTPIRFWACGGNNNTSTSRIILTRKDNSNYTYKNEHTGTTDNYPSGRKRNFYFGGRGELTTNSGTTRVYNFESNTDYCKNNWVTYSLGDSVSYYSYRPSIKVKY